LFFDDLGINYSEVNTIRSSYIYKILEKFSPTANGGMEDHMNACTILSELADYKPLYLEMLSSRAFEVYKEYLGSDSSSSK